MAVSVVHAKTSALPDDPTASAAGEVLPSDWNAAHTVTGLGTLATQNGTFSGTSSGTNTGDQTNISGNAATVTTNANLTGPITSVGNATSIASQTGTGSKFVVDDTPTLITPNIGAATGASLATSKATGTATSVDGLVLATSDVATVGAQKYSPRQRWTASGWKTTATAAAQVVDWIAEVQPVQGAANPSANLVFSAQINGGGYTAQFSMTSAGAFTTPDGSATAPGLQIGASAAQTMGIFRRNTGISFSDGSNPFVSFRPTFSAINVKAATVLGWSSSATEPDSPDVGLARNAIGVIEVNNNTAGTYRDLVARNHYVAPSSANGQSLGILCLTELTTIAAAAATDTAIQMPAGAIVYAVSARVTVAITCTTNFNIGDSGSATRFATNLSKAATTTNAGTVVPYVNASALSVRITPDTTPSDNTGRVRITIYYMLSTPPTS